MSIKTLFKYLKLLPIRPLPLGGRGIMIHWKVKVLALVGLLFASSYYYNESNTRDLASVPKKSVEAP